MEGIHGERDVDFSQQRDIGLVDLPKGVKPIRCRWVYKLIYNVDDSINRYNARLVAKGYAQTHDINYA